MDGDRGLALLADPDQWSRCDHRNTTLLADGGVQLTWVDPPVATAPAQPSPAGLVFDRWSRAYRSHPQEGRVSVRQLHGGVPDAEPSPDPDLHVAGPLRVPLGLAIDANQLLYIAEAGAGAVLIVDLWTNRLVRRMPVRTRENPRCWPADVAALGAQGVALVRDGPGLVLLRGTRGPRPGPPLVRPDAAAAMDPIRLAGTPDERLLVLWRDASGASLVATSDGKVVADQLVGATDVEVLADGGDGVLVVAGDPEHRADAAGPATPTAAVGTGTRAQPFRRFSLAGVELEPVFADGYDGGAISTSPDGTIAYTTHDGVRWVAGSAAVHPPWPVTDEAPWADALGAVAGRTTSYRLDAQLPGTRWGRVFVDACIPPGTDVRLRFLSSDDDEQLVPPVTAQPPGRWTGVIPWPDSTPPMPSSLDYEDFDRWPESRLFSRPTGREQPWAQIAVDDRFETYEAPVLATPGRYLWVAVELVGTASTTPRVRALRIERPGHALLSLLPRAWSRQEDDARFLQGFLAPAEGLLHELDVAAFRRALLLDPATAPQEMLAWLATFTGLALDRRWPEPARRTLIREAYPLFRRRGTLGGLRRLLELYLGYRPVLLEHWRLRGLGGAVLGARPAAEDQDSAAIGARGGAVVGRSLRIGGAATSSGGSVDGFVRSAHRFSVLVRPGLTIEQLAVVQRILDDHQPAHALGVVQEIATMRVGAAHVALTTMVGPAGTFGPAVLGHFGLGEDGVVGVPTLGSRLGLETVVGQVVVG